MGASFAYTALVAFDLQVYNISLVPFLFLFLSLKAHFTVSFNNKFQNLHQYFQHFSLVILYNMLCHLYFSLPCCPSVNTN